MGTAIAQTIIIILQIYNLIILARILMSWIQVDRSNQFVRLVHDLTEPVLAPIRNILPQAGMFDFSPLIATFLIQILVNILASVAR
jgi:YggT family protein